MKHLYFCFLVIFLNLVQNAQVTMVTNMPPKVAPNANLTIEVKINKGSIGNFSKYEMEVPEGFSATEGNSKTGYFTFEKNRVKIVWVTLPQESEFIVSFKLKTPSNAAPVILYQKFYYIENGVKKEVVGQQIDVIVDPAGVTKTLSYLPEQPEEPIIASEPMNPPVKINVTPQTTQTVVTPAQPTKTITATPAATIAPVVATNNSQNGLTYLVQIGTYSTDPGKAKFSDLGKVTVEKVGAAFKVLIGEYNTKEDAFKKREELTTKGYNGFVVTYQNGQRVK